MISWTQTEAEAAGKLDLSKSSKYGWRNAALADILSPGLYNSMFYRGEGRGGGRKGEGGAGGRKGETNKLVLLVSISRLIKDKYLQSVTALFSKFRYNLDERFSCPLWEIWFEIGQFLDAWPYSVRWCAQDSAHPQWLKVNSTVQGMGNWRLLDLPEYSK